MAKAEKTPLDKKDYISRFTLRGAAVVGDMTFSIDNHSETSDWVYNRMSLGVNCGESGVCYAQMMGGYGSLRDTNVIYVHGKTEDGKDDYKNIYTIDWDDRKDPNIISDLGDGCFYTVAVEKTTTGNLIYEKFLSQYDAIEYAQKVITNGMEIAISGDITYQEYNDKITMNKEIRRIIAVEPDESKRHANITQTILLDRDSLGDKTDKGTYEIYGYVLEWMKSYKGVSLAKDGKKGDLVPLKYTFEFAPNNVTDDKVLKKMFTKIIPKKNVNQITFTGEFIEGGSVIKPTLDDIDEDIKELIELGLMTEESVLADCAGNAPRERRVVLRTIKSKPNKDGKNSPMIIDGKYTDEDLEMDINFIPLDDDDVPEEFMESPSDEDDEFSALFGDS